MASLDTTTLVCLFHHHDQAEGALQDILKAGVPEQAVTLIGGDGTGIDALDKSELAELEMPDGDYDHLKQGIGAGGTVVAVQSVSDHVATVEDIFKKHSAAKIDEADTEHSGYDAAALPVATGPVAVDDESLLYDGGLPVDEAHVVTATELTSEPFKSAGGSYAGTVRLYRFDTTRQGMSFDPAEEPEDIDRLPTKLGSESGS